MSPAALLFGLFLLVPLAEVGVFIQVGGLIGLWPTLAATVLTAIIGSLCIRFQGFNLINKARAQMQAGEAPVFEVISGVCLVLAGALLLTPGFVTDTVGFILLLPPARRLFYDRFLVHRMTTMGTAAPGSPPPGTRKPVRPIVIEGDFEPMNDAGGDMPPPRGSWDKPS